MKRPRTQKCITDYYALQKPKRGDPVSLLHPPANHPSEQKTYSHKFATILDLPNELLLSILDYLRQHGSDHPSMLLQPNYLEYLHEELDIDAARRLYTVCKRFYSAFQSVKFQRITCGQNLSLLKSALKQDKDNQGVFAEKVKEIHLHFEEPSSYFLQLQGHRCISTLPNLTAVTLHNINLDQKLVVILGALKHLTTLAYNVPLPRGLLRNFEKSTLIHSIPQKLKSLHVQFSCADQVRDEMKFLLTLLEASSKTLTTIVITLFDIIARRRCPPDAIFLMQFPNLKRFAIYHLADSWNSFSRFYDRPAGQLQEVQTVAQVDFHPRFFNQNPYKFSQMPGIAECDDPNGYTWKRYDMYLDIDPGGKLSAREGSIEHGHWEMLYVIQERHEYLRVLNIWDGCFLKYPFKILQEIGGDFKHLEVLRFNCEPHQFHREGLQVEPIEFCDAEEQNDWCDCTTCSRNVYTTAERAQISEEWENTNWAEYESQIEQLVRHFPKLKVVEWFLPDLISLFYGEYPRTGDGK